MVAIRPRTQVSTPARIPTPHHHSRKACWPLPALTLGTISRGGYVERVDEEAITIRLTRDQGFVLSDWLYQVMLQSDDLEGIVHDRAVWSPIYAISGTLDKTLSEIFMPDYGLRLEAAKE